jgi:hypothetical protein
MLLYPNGDYLFRPVSLILSRSGFSYLCRGEGYKTVAVLYNNADLQQRIYEAFVQSVEALGGKIVETQAYSGAMSRIQRPFYKIAGRKRMCLMPYLLNEVPLQIACSAMLTFVDRWRHLDTPEVARLPVLKY